MTWRTNWPQPGSGGGTLVPAVPGLAPGAFMGGMAGGGTLVPAVPGLAPGAFMGGMAGGVALVPAVPGLAPGVANPMGQTYDWKDGESLLAAIPLIGLGWPAIRAFFPNRRRG